MIFLQAQNKIMLSAGAAELRGSELAESGAMASPSNGHISPISEQDLAPFGEQRCRNKPRRVRNFPGLLQISLQSIFWMQHSRAGASLNVNQTRSCIHRTGSPAAAPPPPCKANSCFCLCRIQPTGAPRKGLRGSWICSDVTGQRCNHWLHGSKLSIGPAP